MEKTTERNTTEYIEKYFPIVKASTLSLEDEFLIHKPKTLGEIAFKAMLVSAIKSGLSDFRAQRIDPSFDKEGKIFYQEGNKPAVRKPLDYMKRVAQEFMPEKESRTGEPKERIAFLGLLIKYLIEEMGYTVSEAWKAVCVKSKDLANYLDSENATRHLEPTGSRPVGIWCDLGNTEKILFNRETSSFWEAGGACNDYSSIYPLSHIDTIIDFKTEDEFVDEDELYCQNKRSTIWMVMSV